jgi:cephalosporin hydroxylase
LIPDPAYDRHKQAVAEHIALLSTDSVLAGLSIDWMNRSAVSRYTYNFEWFGRPIIQYPQDVFALQEIIWEVRPDLVIETGIAHGGSLVFSASMLALLELADAAKAGGTVDPRHPARTVLGIDIDIRPHNRAAIEAHPMASRIRMIQGSSIDPDVVRQVREAARGKQSVLVVLDSNHTHKHVLAELEAYGPLVSGGSYCVVFDTVVEHMPKELFPDRPWGPGDNPKTAVQAWLRGHPEFQIDRRMSDKLQITVAPDGYLKRSEAPPATQT